MRDKNESDTLHRSVREVVEYLRATVESTSKVRPLRAPAETALALLDRVSGLMLSLSLLGGPEHYQTHLSITRTLFEFTVDLTLLHSEPGLHDKIVAWEDSERYELALDFVKNARDLPLAAVEEATRFIARTKDRIMKVRAQHWKGQHPRNRWTGNSFVVDLRKAHAIAPAVRLRPLHTQLWKLMCWNAHGGGAVLWRRPDSGTLLFNTSSIAFHVCPDLAFAAAELALRTINGFGSDEQIALSAAQERRLAILAAIVPDGFRSF